MKTQNQNSVNPDTQSCQMAVSGSVIDFPIQLDIDILAKYGFLCIGNKEFKRNDCDFIIKQKTEELFTIDHDHLSLQVHSEHQLKRAYLSFEYKELLV
jgi:hypothetical protein